MKCLIWIFGVTVTWLSLPPAFAAEGAQPLTRADCAAAGKAWDDRANVCGGSENAAESKKEKKKKKRGSKHKKDQSRLKEEPPEADSP
jgi:hypothetical protein